MEPKNNMFPPLIVTLAFFFMILSVFVVDWNERWFPKMAKIVTFILALTAGIYVFCTGIYLLSGWEEYIASRSGSLSETAQHRRGGILFLFFRYLPYALIGFSSFAIYGQTIMLTYILKKRRI